LENTTLNALVLQKMQKQPNLSPDKVNTLDTCRLETGDFICVCNLVTSYNTGSFVCVDPLVKYWSVHVEAISNQFSTATVGK